MLRSTEVLERRRKLGLLGYGRPDNSSGSWSCGWMIAVWGTPDPLPVFSVSIASKELSRAGPQADGIRHRHRMKLLQCHRHVDRVKESARLSVDLHNGTARYRLTHSRGRGGQVASIARIVCRDGINAGERKRHARSGIVTREQGRADPRAVGVKIDAPCGITLSRHLGGKCEWSALGNLRRTC